VLKDIPTKKFHFRNQQNFSLYIEYSYNYLHQLSVIWWRVGHPSMTPHSHKVNGMVFQIKEIVPRKLLINKSSEFREPFPDCRM